MRNLVFLAPTLAVSLAEWSNSPSDSNAEAPPDPSACPLFLMSALLSVFRLLPIDVGECSPSNPVDYFGKYKRQERHASRCT